MAKVRCEGSLCWDEETGKVYFLPSKCDREAYATVRSRAVERGIGFANPVEQMKPTSPKKV